MKTLPPVVGKTLILRDFTAVLCDTESEPGGAGNASPGSNQVLLLRSEQMANGQDIVSMRARQRVPRESISLSQRFQILRRDKFTCQYCGAKAPDAALHVDHVKPVVDGGDNSPANLIAACVRCNLGKGTKSDQTNDERPDTERERKLGAFYEWFIAHHNIWSWAADVYCGEDPEFRLVLLALAHWADPHGVICISEADIPRVLHMPLGQAAWIMCSLMSVGLLDTLESKYDVEDEWSLCLPWVPREGDEHIPHRKLATYRNFLLATTVHG